MKAFKPNFKQEYKKLLKVLKKAQQHLDYCGYGDKWEQECAIFENLPCEINSAIKNGERLC